MKIVLADLEFLMKEAQEIRADLDEAGEDTAVMMLDDHIASYEKEIWFINSMMA